MVDEVDFRIISILMEEGDISFSELARRLNLSESTIRKRVEKLKRGNVINKFTVIVDPYKLGFNSVAIVGVDVEPQQLLKVAKKLCELPEAKNVFISTGDHMIMVEIWARDGNDLSRILSEGIGGIEGVKRVCPSIILERLKY
ncbi:Lrp/AsnC family transcriptional regulator [Candidatus Culexarchaeum yellowstonense]|jgi:Lrp/AsnC family transcriptional regulator for asnA, asnC and gidA|uniref:Lrp/AsnC family transcriptional regulator n=1 Tax=Candidatus Culexarchaeum yellowstonense TaxID=2928963 RepID=UPI0026ECFEE8|nr:Lrp/AsnC family transcriptional regulator [Candidatus Culexarchaeum yellowstonense]